MSKIVKNEKTFFISAIEPSGDLLGTNLLIAINSCPKFKKHRAYGICGKSMCTLDITPVAHSEDFSVMGFTEVIKKIARLKMLEDRILRDIERIKPEFVILIDGTEFHIQFAEKLKLRGFKVFQYVAPKVWAWRQDRVIKIRDNFSAVFGILPFEEEFFISNKVNYKYIGCPIKDRIEKIKFNKRALGIDDSVNLVACLPGSRKSELTKMLPAMKDITKIIKQKINNTEFIVPLAPSLDINEIATGCRVSVSKIKVLKYNYENISYEVYKVSGMTFIKGMSLELLAAADAAIVASGTATLECGLLETPLAVIYIMDEFSYNIAKSKIDLPYISLINLVAQEEIVKEFLQNFSPYEVANEIIKLLTKSEYKDAMIKSLKTTKDSLGSSNSDVFMSALVDSL